MSKTSCSPLLSLVVVIFNMRREAPRTLYTLKSTFQGVRPDLYEVIVVENGSSDIFGEESVYEIDQTFKYLYFDATNPSPSAAINFAARQARGSSIGILIDGARMLSPGIIRYSLLALASYSRPLISTLGCHIGHKPQQQSVLDGYNEEEEDILLDSIDWSSNGYKLFDISSLAGSSKYGILAPLAESNALFMTRQMFEELGGLDEAFTSPGGGLVNLDFYQRAQSLHDVNLVTLLGEATFHQIHGGVTTNAKDNWSIMSLEYQEIRGKSFEPYPLPFLKTDYIGKIHEPFIPWLESSISEREKFLLDINKSPIYFDNNSSQDLKQVNQKILAVLGMHRSGTSLLTGTLQEAGLVLGDVVTQAPHNLKGNRESLQIRTLHEDLMQRSGGDWDRPPEYVSWEPIHKYLLDLITNNFSNVSYWGFKDPRSIFCLEGWLEALPNLQCVGIFRHPEEVARSLNARNGLSIEDGINLWYKYNSKILEWHQKLEFPLIHFCNDPVLFSHNAVHLISILDLPRKLSIDQLNFYDPKLVNQKSNDLPLEIHVQDLYDDLLAKSINSQNNLYLAANNDSKLDQLSGTSNRWRFQSWSWWRTIRNR